jgi:HK97 family phage prohead protease
VTDLHVRTAHLRAADDDTRTISGIAVPWKKPAAIRDWFGSYTETFERGSIEVPDTGKVMLFWRHDEPIGIVTEHRDDEAGWFVSARISETPRGDEAYALLRDGVVTEFSIGFEPIEHRTDDETGDITRTRVIAREVSVVPFGAYGAEASVTEVRKRADNPNPLLERSNPMTDTTVAPDLIEVRERIDELERRSSTFTTREESPVLDTRTAGEVLKAIASGDEATIRAYNDIHQRAYTGGTTADIGTAQKPGWVGDLTRIFDASSGVLAATFSTGTLPETGNTIEFAELAANTLTVAEQAAEGDDIAAGKVTITTRTAPVKTYAGSTSLTRQEVERATVGVLNTSLNGLAIAAGARRKAYLRAAYETLVAAREGIAANGGVVVLGAVLGSATAGNWEDALIDAAIKFEAQNLPLERMIVSATVFKKLRSLTVAGERVFQTSKDNSSGTLDLPGLSGDFASVPVLLDSGATGDKAAFVNPLAIRQYNSPLVQLSDEVISNLTKSFAVYAYGATAAEIPAGVVPVKLAAS